jgi:hypothetical protein
MMAELDSWGLAKIEADAGSWPSSLLAVNALYDYLESCPTTSPVQFYSWRVAPREGSWFVETTLEVGRFIRMLPRG